MLANIFLAIKKFFSKMFHVKHFAVNVNVFFIYKTIIVNNKSLTDSLILKEIDSHGQLKRHVQ